MDGQIQKDIISVLQQTISLVEHENFAALKELSRHVIHDASIYQDQDSLQAAVVVYALSKIFERAKFQNERVPTDIPKIINGAIKYLEQGNEQAYRTEISRIFHEISQRDRQLLMYVQNVIEQAHIVKGSDIYSHGISLARVSEITGINQWDLMSFVGKTRIADRDEGTESSDKRLAFAKKLFKVL